MEPIVVAGVLLVPSAIVFVLGCSLAAYRTIRSGAAPRRVRQLSGQQPR